MCLSKNILHWWSLQLSMETIVPEPAQLPGQCSACTQRLDLIFQVSGHHTFNSFGSETELGPQILWWQPGTAELPPEWSDWGCNTAAEGRPGICWCDTRIWSKSEWTRQVWDDTFCGRSSVFCSPQTRGAGNQFSHLSFKQLFQDYTADGLRCRRVIMLELSVLFTYSYDRLLYGVKLHSWFLSSTSKPACLVETAAICWFYDQVWQVTTLH